MLEGISESNLRLLIFDMKFQFGQDDVEKELARVIRSKSFNKRYGFEILIHGHGHWLDD
jgi:hypothetical protein